jgi:hypothetical protein
VWSSVVRDLLLISPNARIQRTFSNMTTEELRAFALRYYASNTRFPQSVSPGKLNRVSTRTYAAIARVRQIRFLPTGAPFAIYISGTTAIHFWDLQTGQDVFIWQPSQASQRVHNFTEAYIDFWDSDDRGSWSPSLFPSCRTSIAFTILPSPLTNDPQLLQRRTVRVEALAIHYRWSVFR